MLFSASVCLLTI